MPEVPIWPSGVGGAQCDRCYQMTIVRSFGGDITDQYYSEEWLCRACYEGWDDDEEDLDV